MVPTTPFLAMAMTTIFAFLTLAPVPARSNSRKFPSCYPRYKSPNPDDYPNFAECHNLYEVYSTLSPSSPLDQKCCFLTAYRECISKKATKYCPKIAKLVANYYIQRKVTSYLRLSDDGQECDRNVNLFKCEKPKSSKIRVLLLLVGIALLILIGLALGSIAFALSKQTICS